jgi:hypothetical protein
VCVKVCKTNGAALRVISLGDAEHTLDTNVNVVLLTLLDLAGIFIRFRERVESFEILDWHTRAVSGALEVGFENVRVERGVTSLPCWE